MLLIKNLISRWPQKSFFGYSDIAPAYSPIWFIVSKLCATHFAKNSCIGTLLLDQQHTAAVLPKVAIRMKHFLPLLQPFPGLGFWMCHWITHSSGSNTLIAPMSGNVVSKEAFVIPRRIVDLGDPSYHANPVVSADAKTHEFFRLIRFLFEIWLNHCVCRTTQDSWRFAIWFRYCRHGA